MGLHDFQLGSLSLTRGHGGFPLPPGCEPWAALSPSPLSTLSHTLPGFLAHPQVKKATECVTDLDSRLEMIIIESI